MTLDSIRAAALLAVVVVVGCGDAPTEPAALLVAEHARAALDVAVPLPSLADAETMDGAEFEVVLADLGVWLDAAEARLDREAAARPELATLRGDVAQGRTALLDAARLEETGERGAAVAALIGAQAHLLRTSAFAVAERSIAAASAADARCRRTEGTFGRNELSIVRGRRLLEHAREALADDDFERAVQRAHYAEAMLDGQCPTAGGVNGGAR